MRHPLFVFAILGMLLLLPAPYRAAVGGGEEIHEVTGPVRVLWETQYDGSASGLDQARSLAVSPDSSRIFVSGFSQGVGTHYDYATLAYDATTGEQIWSVSYDGPQSTIDMAFSLAVSPDGLTVFVAGSSIGNGTSFDYATLAYDAGTGVALWTARYAGMRSNETAKSLAVGPDGEKVFVTGDLREVGTGRDNYLTVAYDARTGEEEWTARYDGPDSSDSAQSLAVSPDGAMVFVTGSSLGLESGSSNATIDFATVGYDAETGEQLWVTRYDGTGSQIYHDHAKSLTVSPDGSAVFVTGHSPGIGTARDYATVGYDAVTGEELWSARYDGGASTNDQPAALAASPDGARVFVTGVSPLSGLPSDYVTLAYDARTGEQIWIARYDGPASGYDAGHALAVSPDGGTVFVTGSSRGAGIHRDYATLAYNAATGEQIWSARSAGPDVEDVAVAISVTPDRSKVVIAGSSNNIGTDWDYATIAYSLVRIVEIDAKPDSYPNSVNPRRRGVIPVAILGSTEFDVAEVDVDTLRFGPADAAARHRGHVDDTDDDGDMDLVVHFRVQKTGIACGDQEVSLSGQTLDGAFIEGTDSIRTTGCGFPKPSNRSHARPESVGFTGTGGAVRRDR